MAGGLSVYLAKKLLDHAFKGTSYSIPATVYFALFSVNPVAGAGGTELDTAVGSYARKSMTNNGTTFATAAGTTMPATKATGAAVAFVQATADWAAAVGWGIYDASTAGNLLLWGPLVDGGGAPVSVTVLSGNVANFASGALTMSMSE